MKEVTKPKHAGGRPKMYKNAEELQAKIDEYFIDGMSKRKVEMKDGSIVEVPSLTITDLVLYLGFNDRQSFYDYGKQPEFSCTIKNARTRIEREYEKALFLCPPGAIFALKNFGWSDKQEVENTNLNVDIGKDKQDPKSIAEALQSIKNMMK